MIKKCILCGEEGEATDNFWRHEYNQPKGNFCRNCNKDKKNKSRSIEISPEKHARDLLKHKHDVINQKYGRTTPWKEPDVIWLGYQMLISEWNRHAKFYRNKLSFDHIHPLSKGGLHQLQNISIELHGKNSSKQAKLPSTEQTIPSIGEKLGSIVNKAMSNNTPENNDIEQAFILTMAEYPSEVFIEAIRGFCKTMLNNHNESFIKALQEAGYEVQVIRNAS
jgi:5-methylcytosine-specific restriction endonuclease McrA